MANIKIKFDDIEDIRFFVNEASKTDLNIDMRVGKRCVDAKSMVGVLSLDLRKNTFINIIGAEDEKDKFLEKINRLVIKNSV